MMLFNFFCQRDKIYEVIIKETTYGQCSLCIESIPKKNNYIKLIHLSEVVDVFVVFNTK